MQHQPFPVQLSKYLLYVTFAFGLDCLDSNFKATAIERWPEVMVGAVVTMGGVTLCQINHQQVCSHAVDTIQWIINQCTGDL